MIEIIPAIDLIDGQCVRLKQGNYSEKKVYSSNPLEMARSFEDAGIKRLHLVDLDGAKVKKPVNINILREITSNTNLSIDYSGGIASEDSLVQVFEAGADFVMIGSIASRKPDLFKEWLVKFGGEKFILAADVKDNIIYIDGWKTSTGINIQSFIKRFIPAGIKNVMSTDISKDGMLNGISLDYYKNLKIDFPNLQFIASGGISTVDEVSALNELGIEGAIIGKALYEGKMQLNDLSNYLKPVEKC